MIHAMTIWRWASPVPGLTNRSDISIAGFDNISAVHPLIREAVSTLPLNSGARFAIFGIEFALEMMAGNTQLVDRTRP